VYQQNWINCQLSILGSVLEVGAEESKNCSSLEGYGIKGRLISGAVGCIILPPENNKNAPKYDSSPPKLWKNLLVTESHLSNCQLRHNKCEGYPGSLIAHNFNLSASTNSIHHEEYYELCAIWLRKLGSCLSI
jgi:hypothetical protein